MIAMIGEMPGRFFQEKLRIAGMPVCVPAIRNLPLNLVALNCAPK